LRKLCADPSLKATITLSNGRQATALDLQRYYWEACRRFLEKRPDAPAEAKDVLVRWAEVLDRLEHERLLLVGEIDWVTKRFLLDQAGASASHASRKKIDLRYHELSEAGYFERLRNEDYTAGILREEEIERAMRAPPSDSPATTRGHYIREFGGGEKLVSANWKYVFLGEGHASRAIRIADYGRVGVPPPKSKRPRKRGSDAV
jgi:proteasome accessory factor A